MTKMRDNFSNPNPFLGQAKNYQDLVNQPHWAEPLADSFKQSASQPAKGPQQRMANAMMGGFASGIQGAVNKERQDRLSPILEQAGQITAKAAELEAQSQQERQRVFTGTKFVRDNITRLSALGEASMARDEIGAQGVARELGRDYQKAFGLNLGEFDHYDVNSRRIFYAKDGVVTGYSIPDTLREYATEAFGEQAPYVMRTLDPYSKNIWENTQAMEQAKLAKEQSSAKMNNSHADLYKAQTDIEKAKLSTPKPKYSDSTLNTFATQNSNWINNNREEHRRLKQEASAYENIAKYIKAEVDDKTLGIKSGRAGSGIISKMQRALNNANTESEKNQVLIQYETQPLMQGLKDIFKGATSDRDIALFIEGLPSLDKNPEASIQVSKARAAEIKKRIKEDEVTQQILEDEFGYSEPYNSLAVQRRVQEKMKFYSNPEDQKLGTVLMIAPDGSQREVPTDKVEFFKSKGAKVVNE